MIRLKTRQIFSIRLENQLSKWPGCLLSGPWLYSFCRFVLCGLEFQRQSKPPTGYRRPFSKNMVQTESQVQWRRGWEGTNQNPSPQTLKTNPSQTDLQNNPNHSKLLQANPNQPIPPTVELPRSLRQKLTGFPAGCHWRGRRSAGRPSASSPGNRSSPRLTRLPQCFVRES